MDVAKYIGLFLLKNNSCYIHGLGNIELRRKPASYDGRNLLPASYEVAVVPATTVDDSLSNFIATNEQISISKASTALREFAEASMAALKTGKEVAIPSLGNFYEVNGKMQFATAPYLQHHYIPLPAEKGLPRRGDNTRTAPQPGYHEQQAQSYTAAPVSAPTQPAYYPQPEIEEERKGGLNWPRVIFFVLLLAALIAGIGFAVKNMLKPGGSMPYNDTAKQNVVMPVQDTSAQVPADTNSFIDTNASMSVDQPATMPAPQINKGALVNFQVILNTYDERARAEKRVQKLKSYGNNVKLIPEDSFTYYVVMPISAYAKDTARVMDSLKRNFNPDGVYIY